MLLRAAVITLAVWLTAFATAAQERVNFPAIDLPGSPSTMLSGLLYRPTGDGPYPAVVGLHGCGGMLFNDKPAPLLAQWGEMLSAEGYIVLLPDSHASRGHAHNLCALIGDARPVQWNRERSRDAYAALRYLKGRKDVRANAVVAFGQSAGAAPILHILSSEVERADWKGTDDFQSSERERERSSMRAPSALRSTRCARSSCKRSESFLGEKSVRVWSIAVRFCQNTVRTSPSKVVNLVRVELSGRDLWRKKINGRSGVPRPAHFAQRTCFSSPFGSCRLTLQRLR